MFVKREDEVTQERLLSDDDDVEWLVDVLDLNWEDEAVFLYTLFCLHRRLQERLCHCGADSSARSIKSSISHQNQRDSRGEWTVERDVGLRYVTCGMRIALAY